MSLAKASLSTAVRLLIYLVGVLLLPTILAAHSPSESFLRLEVDDSSIAGRWDIALRDLEHALGLDVDLDGAITWDELRSRRAEVEAYVLGRLDMGSGGSQCRVESTGLRVANHDDGGYAVLDLDGTCPRGLETMSLDYRLFFDLDPGHRGLVRVRSIDDVTVAVLSPEAGHLAVPLAQHGDVAPSRAGRRWAAFSTFWREGVWHIWIGFDHVLFLLTLLLPIGLRWRPKAGWCAQAPADSASAQSSFIASVAGPSRDALAVVTAFTVAHSLTLIPAALGWLSLPGRLVESVIAGTVVIAAADNLRPFLPTPRAVTAFILGLVHGFGFAGALTELGLEGAPLAVSLFGFNLGVECGQLAIVALFLPLTALVRGHTFYRGPVVRFGSVAIGGIAVVWFLERAVNLQLLP